MIVRRQSVLAPLLLLLVAGCGAGEEAPAAADPAETAPPSGAITPPAGPGDALPAPEPAPGGELQAGETAPAAP